MEGQRIGSYRVVRKIGQGGMGAVYEAVHEQLGGKRAIKLLRKELASDRQIEHRFLNEARAANRVNHSGIVKIDEFGHLPDGSAFIIMEYLHGDALSQRLRSRGGRLPILDTIRISRQIASALAATHAIQIVHRDLKPDNVMLVPDSEMPGGERVKILDFGIAKGVSELSGPVSEDYRTDTGMVLGTATYMAPEQCKGAGNVTDRSDVYSLGVMMYRMCCGSLPFRAEGQGEVMAMHIFSTPKPLRDHDASIPRPMADLVARMMNKEPTDRPSMTQVAQELEQMLGSTTTANQPVVAVVGLPPGEVVSVASTLSAALGQSGNMKALEERPQRRPRLWLGALATVGLVALGLGVRFTVVRMSAPTVLPPSNVTWAPSSNPSNAKVVRKADGKVLCTTPCNLRPELGAGRVPVVFRLPGYADAELVLDETRSFGSIVTLRPEPASLMPPMTPPMTPPTAPLRPPPSSALDPGSSPPASDPAPIDTAGKPGPTPRINPPATRPLPGIKRVPTEPAAGRPVKLPTLPIPKRPSGASESVLTDDKIMIIQ